MSDSSTDLPAPVGPTIRVWPTSPTCRLSRNGVEPSVLPNRSGGAWKCSSLAGPAQTAERDDVRQVQRRDRRLADVGVGVSGNRPEPGLQRIHPFRHAGEVAALDHLLDQPQLLGCETGSASQTVTVAVT